MKAIIINSKKKDNPYLFNIFQELKTRGFSFYYFSTKNYKLNNLKLPIKKIFVGPKLNNNFKSLLFIFFLPFLIFWYFFIILNYKYKKKIKTIICLNWNEKIIFSSIAKILKLKIIWLENPEINYSLKPKILILLYRFFSKKVKIICFINFTKTQLKNLKIKDNNINLILPGIKLKQLKRQETIYTDLVKTEQKNNKTKFFTLGIISKLEKNNQIENLFKAIKNSLTVIPNLQLIVVGDGAERKNLIWLAKKMEIDNLVWFVGGPEKEEQSFRLKKWLDSFDIYIAINEETYLSDLAIILKAMACSLPIIGFVNQGYEDIIIHDKTGLLTEAGNAESLTQEIIKLQQNKRLRLNLGKNAQNLVDKKFTIDKMVGELAKILK